MGILRRRMFGSPASLPDPIFRLDFSNGLTPAINEQGVNVSTNRTVTVSQGYATFNRGRIILNPKLTAVERTYRLKFKATYQDRWTEVFRDYPTSGTGLLSGCYLRAGTYTNAFTVGSGYETVELGTNFAVNTDYDVVLSLSQTKASVYVNKALAAEQALTGLKAPEYTETDLGNSDSSNYYQYRGIISLFEFWDKPLTANQVAKLE